MQKKRKTEDKKNRNGNEFMSGGIGTYFPCV